VRTPYRANSGSGGRARGFTLLEVMISLIIVSIGLLGIAKIHALAYSSTATAGTRSLVALQAAGLAASMHSNRTYWAAGFATPIKITNTAIDDATLDAAAATADYCVFGSGTTPCTPPVMAAFELHTYAAQLSAALPNSTPTTIITCPKNPTPVNCTIKVTWNEKAVSINQQGLAGTGPSTFAPAYMLYVEP
jgi:type IV pilus assembly protein PilV